MGWQKGQASLKTWDCGQFGFPLPSHQRLDELSPRKNSVFHWIRLDTSSFLRQGSVGRFPFTLEHSTGDEMPAAPFLVQHTVSMTTCLGPLKSLGSSLSHFMGHPLLSLPPVQGSLVHLLIPKCQGSKRLQFTLPGLRAPMFYRFQVCHPM